MARTKDTESQRLTWFLMGTVLALSTLLTALEYKSSYNDADIDDDILEDMAADIEPYPIVETNTVMPTVAVREDKASEDVLKVAKTEDKEAENPFNNDDVADVGTDMDEANAADNSTEEREELADKGKEADDVHDFRVVQQIPEFPGGMRAFVQWLTANLRYPPAAQKRKAEGLVVVTFIVNADGSATNIKVARSADAILNAEALRVMRMMPKWKPGVENDKPCRTMMAIPISFKL